MLLQYQTLRLSCYCGLTDQRVMTSKVPRLCALLVDTVSRVGCSAVKFIGKHPLTPRIYVDFLPRVPLCVANGIMEARRLNVSRPLPSPIINRPPFCTTWDDARRYSVSHRGLRPPCV